jgi:hypothetical protein
MTTHTVIKGGKEITIEMPDPVVKKKAKRTKPFAQVELDLAAKMAEAIGTPRAFILVMLWHLAWQAKGQPFPFTNEILRKYGVSRDVKRKVLVALEAAGLIKIERHGIQSPIVTIINYTVVG